MSDRRNATIRRDLFGIKVFDEVAANETGYMLVRVCRSRETVRQILREMNDIRRPYPLVKPKVVHPAQWIVDAFVAFGNRIED